MELGVPYIALPSFLFQLLAIEMLLFPTDERLHLFLLISSGVEEGNDAFIGIRTVGKKKLLLLKRMVADLIIPFAPILRAVCIQDNGKDEEQSHDRAGDGRPVAEPSLPGGDFGLAYQTHKLIGLIHEGAYLVFLGLGPFVGTSGFNAD